MSKIHAALVAPGVPLTAPVPPRAVGLPAGWAGREQYTLDARGGPNALWAPAGQGPHASGRGAQAKDRTHLRDKLLVAPDPIAEGPPVAEELDAIRYAGHAPLHSMWDGAAQGSVRGVRGRSLHRDHAKLLSDYMRKQVGAGFVPGLEAPPPNVARWPVGEPRAPLPNWQPPSVFAQGVLRTMSRQLSAKAAAKGVKWSLRTALVNDYAGESERVARHYGREIEEAREKPMHHLFWPHKAVDEDGSGDEEEADGGAEEGVLKKLWRKITGAVGGRPKGGGLQPYERDEAEELVEQLRQVRSWERLGARREPRCATARERGARGHALTSPLRRAFRRSA
jgi:hypothetical protein